MKTISIIGCGAVGKTLAKLWCEKGIFALGQIINRHALSAQNAVKFVGDGQVATHFADLKPADIWLIATPDDAINDCCEKLAATGVLSASDVVFHVSGALSSACLTAVTTVGAATASLHPIKSFVNPEASVKSFAGTYCTFEGQAAAETILQKAVMAIGGHFIHLTAANKPLYHAGTAILCNYLCTLVEFGLDALEASGLDRNEAAQAVTPIVRETLANTLNLGGKNALTGPIARGDMQTVHKQVDAMRALPPENISAFNALGLLTVELAAKKGGATAGQLDAIRKILKNETQ